MTGRDNIEIKSLISIENEINNLREKTTKSNKIEANKIRDSYPVI